MIAILDFSEAVAAGPTRVGGKAWNLGRLARWGFPVPRGIVVDVSVYDGVTGNERISPLIAQAAEIDASNVIERQT